MFIRSIHNAVHHAPVLTFARPSLPFTIRISKHTLHINAVCLRSSWEPWEDTFIRDYIAQNGCKYRDLVEHCLPHRTVTGVEQRWNEHLDPSRVRGGFSKQELATVRRAVNELGEGHWTEISKNYLPQRTPRSIRYNYYYHCVPSEHVKAKRKPWTAEEDALLLRGYKEYNRQWTQISRKYLPHRSHVGIRDRYDETLDPTIKTDPWTESEYDLLLRRHIMYGDDWNKVAEGLAGRTPRACQRKWIQKVEPSIGGGKKEWSTKETRLFWHLACAHDFHWPQVAKLLGRDRVACSNKFYDDIRAMQPLLDNELDQLSNETMAQWKRRIGLRMRHWTDSGYTVDTSATGALMVTGGDWTDEEIETLKDTIHSMQRIDWQKVAAKVGKSPVRCRRKHKELLGPQVRREPWAPEEDEQLLQLVHNYDTQWERIAQEMSHRSAQQCMSRWYRHLKYRDEDKLSNMKQGNFSEQEKALVQEGVHMFGNNWVAIAKTYLPQRTAAQCMRWWKQHGQNSGRWTAEEDDKLRFAVCEFGENSWKDVGALVLTRTPHQCRIRWIQTLDPNIKRGRWSQEEQIRLAELAHVHKDESSRVDWKAVAKKLGTGRTSWTCKYKYQHMVQTGNQFGLRHRNNKKRL
ncbi:Homeodomain-like protein [Zychaea mexicana]|uniref:Homeodomain-like protein n=1 Tax=Zychaea mexicana TaxID=64656 RepID=UPI0022FED4B8|nr:Homeodomain-like protein [Zychaea mexicana]KAI9494532.1 Homeodomain-like protein [Zychaea mexicana]